MTESRNPWLTADAPSATQQAAASAATAVPLLTGPAAPQPHVSAPDAVDRLPQRHPGRTASLWWVGAHGGAGESTLAALLAGSRASNHTWPTAPDGQREAAVLVARTSMSGLRAAQRAATDWASGNVPVNLLGLVLIADAPGRLPRPLRDFSSVIAGGVPRVWHLPWIEAWRLSDTPTAHPAPKQLQRLIEDLHQVVPSPASRPQHPLRRDTL